MVIPKTYTIKEAARMSNYSVSWWRKEINQGRVECMRPGNKILISEHTIEHVLKESVVRVKKHDSL